MQLIMRDLPYPLLFPIYEAETVNWSSPLKKLIRGQRPLLLRILLTEKLTGWCFDGSEDLLCDLSFVFSADPVVSVDPVAL